MICSASGFGLFFRGQTHPLLRYHSNSITLQNCPSPVAGFGSARAAKQQQQQQQTAAAGGGGVSTKKRPCGGSRLLLFLALALMLLGAVGAGVGVAVSRKNAAARAAVQMGPQQQPQPPSPAGAGGDFDGTLQYSVNIKMAPDNKGNQGPTCDQLFGGSSPKTVGFV